MHSLTYRRYLLQGVQRAAEAQTPDCEIPVEAELVQSGVQLFYKRGPLINVHVRNSSGPLINVHPDQCTSCQLNA